MRSNPLPSALVTYQTACSRRCRITVLMLLTLILLCGGTNSASAAAATTVDAMVSTMSTATGVTVGHRGYGYRGRAYGYGSGLRFELGLGYPYRRYGGYVPVPCPRGQYLELPRAEPKLYVERPPARAVWYYCPGSSQYYPHVVQCNTPWVSVDPASVAVEAPPEARAQAVP